MTDTTTTTTAAITAAARAHRAVDAAWLAVGDTATRRDLGVEAARSAWILASDSHHLMTKARAESLDCDTRAAAAINKAHAAAALTAPEILAADDAEAARLAALYCLRCVVGSFSAGFVGRGVLDAAVAAAVAVSAAARSIKAEATAPAAALNL